MEVIAGLLGVAAGVFLYLLRRADNNLANMRLDLLSSKMVAEAATHAGIVLAKNVKDRDDKIEQLIEYIGEEAGNAGLVDILNDELLPSGGGSNGPKGMPN